MPTPAHVACRIGGVGLTIGLGAGLFTGALDLLTDLKISSCHVILCSKVRSCFEIALAVLFPSELLGSSSMTNCYYLKHFQIFKTCFASDGKGERQVILDIKLSESGEGSKERDHGK